MGRLDSHGPASPDRADSRHGTASFGDGEQELDVGCRLGGHGGSGLSRRDPVGSERPVALVVLCHDSVSLRCGGAGRRLSEASQKLAPSVASLTGYARWLTII